MLGILFLIPAYVLIDSQIDVYSASVELASQKITNYESVSGDLIQSSKQAGLIIEGVKQMSVSQYLELFDELQDSKINLSEISISKTDKGIEPVLLIGEASDRQALAAFRDRLLATPQVSAVDLPISNLAKDKDIQFSITVTIDNALTS